MNRTPISRLPALSTVLLMSLALSACGIFKGG